jgi:hypothetical protein
VKPRGALDTAAIIHPWESDYRYCEELELSISSLDGAPVAPFVLEDLPDVSLNPIAAAEVAEEAGLRYVSDVAPGIHRTRRGNGFRYLLAVLVQAAKPREMVSLDPSLMNGKVKGA